MMSSNVTFRGDLLSKNRIDSLVETAMCPLLSPSGSVERAAAEVCSAGFEGSGVAVLSHARLEASKRERTAPSLR